MRGQQVVPQKGTRITRQGPVGCGVLLWSLPDRPTGLHLIRIIQGSILGLLGVPARRRDDVGSRPTAAGGLAMYRP